MGKDVFVRHKEYIDVFNFDDKCPHRVTALFARLDFDFDFFF